MRRLVFFLVILGSRASVATAIFNSSGAGTSTAQFLKLGADARGVAMGQAMTAVDDDASSLYWNPAALAQVRQRNVTFTHSIMYQSVFYDFIAYAQPVKSILQPERREMRPNGLGTLAMGMLYLNAGQISERDNTGLQTGDSFTPQDFAFIASWGASLTDILDLGIGFKYINSRIVDTAQTGAVDAGARLNLHLGEWPYALAASAQNVGSGLRYREHTDPLPTSLRVGQSLRPLPGWTLSSDFVLPRDNAPYPAFGSELRLPVERNLGVALRGGWSGRVNSTDLDGMAGLSFGMGLDYAGFMVDYAWVPFGVLGNTHRFSLAYRF